MISKSAKIIRNSLIVLALAGTAPLALAADPSNNSAHFNVPVQSAAPRHVLDLKAPDIRDVMSADEIAAALPNPDESTLDPETVQVHGAVPAPYVPGGFAALYWAAYHPTDAWRILTPVQ